MKVETTNLSDVLILTPQVFSDERGWFMEAFNARSLITASGNPGPFVQDNHSRSESGVLRGLHYQIGAHPQGKLVRVLRGEILDVAVDLRRDSPTLGQWTSARLSAQNRRQLWVPIGFAHGFIALENGTEVLYKVTDYYDPDGERCIAWDDPELGIDWQFDGSPVRSAKDRLGVPFSQAELFLPSRPA